MTTRIRARRAQHTKTGPSRWKRRLLDFGIVAATGLVCLFIFSFSTRLSYSGSDKLEPPVVIRVQVLNGCGRPGLAGRISEKLTTLQVDRMRFDVVDIGNFDRTTIRQTLVINRHLTSAQARDIMAALSAGDFTLQDATSQSADLGVDLTIVLGSETLEPEDDLHNESDNE